MTNLPTWLEKALPAPKPHLLLSKENDQWIVSADDEPRSSRKEFSTLKAAHQFLTESENDFRLDPNADKEGERLLTYSSNRDRLLTLVMDSNDEKRRSFLEAEFQEFLEAAERYHAAPHDFLSAYEFLDCHPIFWLQPSSASPWFWTTSSHCTSFYQHPHWDSDKGEVVFELEAGPHVDWEGQHGDPTEPYRVHSHDYRLDARGSSFEEAIIHLAFLVDKFYNDDGSEKKDVPHQAPSWVEEVKATSQELDRYLASDEP